MVAQSRSAAKGWRALFGAELDRPAPRFVPPAPAPHVELDSETQIEEVRRCLYDLTTEVKRLALRLELRQLCEEEPQLRSLYRHLSEQEFSQDLALSLVQSIASELNRHALADYRVVRERAAAHIARLVPCERGSLGQAKPGTVLFLVGPTGVGKTTTIAKLAAQLALMEKREVVLVGADTYRIGAEAQLQTYADIMRLPLEIVRSAEEMANLVQRRRNADLILVDMPGRSQRNQEGLAEAAALVGAVPAERRRVELVISASTRLHELEDILAAFGRLGAQSLIVTKLDEALHFGPLISLVAKQQKPLTYFCAGQNVPEDIAQASAAHLAELALGGY